jgi:ribosomal protein L37AE/L43A
MAKETPINHNGTIAGNYHTCNCGAKLMKRISIRTGQCQECRNKAAVERGIRR